MATAQPAHASLNWSMWSMWSMWSKTMLPPPGTRYRADLHAGQFLQDQLLNVVDVGQHRGGGGRARHGE
ncbi:hypothetical protein [Streptomyces spectabilis]|uniref:Uncharacterized protein n=1 Tax=Streptomyces spectabilis TaxID=68270 RepID=A0A516RJW2_STRST|nr:hypothetical protein [Streptomyces spectabilis]QDQ15950.1 hypothetical protein FH965_39860 [Streptomyces spectabilis]